ncbi:DUF2478 domain-containing protein [Roseospira marina]|uniref:DUF2478 domain-containing protein n=1 Tax=Roseospira marina TaxID=140057 RepID=A0A5M6ICG4_9PROT|nr:DUF2478 domain-containing protein [Roseospira marina]KAA5605667.1 DUF2478 domain-containing protein [Roseospira marina]MBB4313255.1 hypothetical protein [Roseospira marina]MBB5086004.1 hypothetical protein [Roseospira marina]
MTASAPPARLDPGPTVPRPRPGPAALVYSGHAGTVEAIPIAFAEALKARGVRVGGLAQRTQRHPETGRKVGMTLLDLATGRPHDIMQALGRDSTACSLDTQGLAGAAPVLRAALDAGVDLLVASKFSHLEAEGGGLAHDMLAAMAEGVPVLTLVPEAHAVDWLRFTHPVGRLLPPSLDACWRWWGPHGLYDDLQALVPPDAVVQRVVIGLNWTLVEGPEGVGLAQTPTRDGAGCRPPPAAGTLNGRPLAELARLAGSLDPMARGLGAAALNTALNRFDHPGDSANGLDLFAEAAVHANAPVMVGAFPGVRERVPALRLIERTPGPDRYPEHAASALIPDAEAVLLTASTFANGSLPGLLALTRPGAEVVLVGPGTPLSPLLFDHGITTLAGFVAEDPDGLARAVAEGAGARTLRRYGRDVVIRTGDGADEPV